MTGEDLQKWRARNKISRDKLSRFLEVSTVTVFRWEKGDRKPPPFLKLALERLEEKLRSSKNE